MKNIPTKEQQDYFFQRVEHYQKILNLLDWRIERSNKPASSGAYAETHFSYPDHLAVIKLGKDFGDSVVSNELLDGTACHEVLHVFFKDLVVAALTEHEHLDTLEHAKVIVLEKLLSNPNL